MPMHQVGNPQRQAVEHDQVRAFAELLERGDNIDRRFDGLKVLRPRRSMKFDARRHLVVERFAGRDEKFALIRQRELQSQHAFAAACAAGD